MPGNCGCGIAEGDCGPICPDTLAFLVDGVELPGTTLELCPGQSVELTLDDYTTTTDVEFDLRQLFGVWLIDGESGDNASVTVDGSHVGVWRAVVYEGSDLNSTACQYPTGPIPLLASIQFTITEVSVGTIAVTPSNASCGVSDGELSITGVATGVEYEVYYNGSSQGTYTAVSGEIVVSNLAKGIYTDIYVTRSGCKSNEIPSVEIIEPNSPPTPIVSGLQTVCSNSSETYNITTPIAGATYTWTAPTGATTDGVPLMTPPITYSSTAQSGDVTVEVDQDGCTAIGTYPITITQGLDDLGAITGDQVICVGTAATYSVPALAGATNYTWTLPSGLTGTSTTETIEVTATGLVEDTIRVTANSDCGSKHPKTSDHSLR